MANHKSFTLTETIIVIVIIGVLATTSLLLINNVRLKARDIKRKAELAQLGRFLTAACYLPDAGAGLYDFADLVNELKSKDERYRQALANISWQDPKTGNQLSSNYKYLVTEDKRCVAYANLENDDETISLTQISIPTPGAGTGSFASSTSGWNGSKNYFQVSN